MLMHNVFENYARGLIVHFELHGQLWLCKLDWELSHPFSNRKSRGLSIQVC